MRDILQEIVAHKRRELQTFRQQLTDRELHRRVETMAHLPVPSLAQALVNSPTGIIAEFKRRSPSKGWIKEDGRADIIPLSYQQHGAAAVSILTDTAYFGGSDAFVTEARQSGVHIPILYKNFVVDEYQLFQARLCGASAVLLIAACLSRAECAQLMGLARELGMEVLLEMHDESELDYADLLMAYPGAPCGVCGVNNRHLGSFVTDVETSFRLASQLPAEAVKVSESGLAQASTVSALRQSGFRGFLIGETFMRAADPGRALSAFINDIRL